MGRASSLVPSPSLIGAGASLLSASSTYNPKTGKTIRANASGFGGWANAGIRVSPDDTFEVGVVATYSWMQLEMGETKVNAGGVGILGSRLLGEQTADAKRSHS